MSAIVTVHLAAAVALSYVEFSLVLAAVLLVLLLICLASLRAAASVSDDQWCFKSDGLVVLINNNTEQLLRVKASSTLFAWGVWLHWETVTAQQKRCGALLWLPDQFAADDWRRLRVWLRHFSQR